MSSVLREELGNNPVIYLHRLLVKKMVILIFFFSAVKHHILGAFHINGSVKGFSRFLGYSQQWQMLNSVILFPYQNHGRTPSVHLHCVSEHWSISFPLRLSVRPVMRR